MESGNILARDLPRKQIRLVQAWVELHREELYINYFESQKDNAQFRKIRPLQ
ncbi:DUF4160 domain-containing protein [Dyadobacter crusticola]|uniref:DUF4160 domain-containing protein n=1 Tax=Dyadobacter crusticola TaxID=292407 RepID=UPI00286E6138|nr:DUF4160 domain-containing protein [Dyadobacter crusticola]